MMPEIIDLSERETEILRLVATGASNKEIAQRLAISPNTVKVHLRNVFGKIGVASRTEATLFAIRQGIVAAPSSLPQTLPEDDLLDVAPIPSGAGLQADAPLAQSVARQRLRWFVAGVIVVLAISLMAWGGIRIMNSSTPTSTPPAAPQSNARWQPRAALPEPRAGLAGVVYENTIYAIGGETGKGPSGSVTGYNPATNTWRALASKPLPVSEIQATLVGEKIYVPGGRLSDGSLSAALEIYDPRHDAWSRGADLPVAVSGYALAAFEGKLYLFGGTDGKQALSSVYEYDPVADAWQSKSAMPTARFALGAAVVSGKIYLMGGTDGTRALAANEVYLPTRDGSGETPWEKREPLPEPRSGMGMVGMADYIYLVGGKGQGAQPPKSYFYIAQQNVWQRLGVETDGDLQDAGMVAYQTELYLLGGRAADGLIDAAQSYTAVYFISMPVVQ